VRESTSFTPTVVFTVQRIFRSGVSEIFHRFCQLPWEIRNISLSAATPGFIQKLTVMAESQFSTVLFSTHILSEVEALCQRVLILINGEIRADARLSDLRSSNDAVMVLNSPVREAVSRLKLVPGVRNVVTIASDCGYPAYRIQGDEQSDICPAVYALASTMQWPLRELRSDRKTLENVFARLAA
jgi:ABC-type multidrug transport system ATPase subunit